MHRPLSLLAGLLVVGIAAPSFADTIATLAQQIPDARLLWVRDGKIYHSKIANFTEQLVTDGWNPRWSPDGKQILFVQDDGVWIMKADFTGKTKVIGDKANTASWTRDGKSITAVAENGYEVKRYVLATKGLTTIFDSRDGNGQKISQAAELRAGGRFLLTFRLTPVHVTEIIDLKDAKNPKYISNAQMERGDCSPAWSPDGKYILNTERKSNRPVLKAVFSGAAGCVTTTDTNVTNRCWIEDSKHLVGLETNEKFYIHGQRVSNDGKYVAFGGKIFNTAGDRDIYIWRIGDPESKAVRMTTHAAEDKTPSLFIPGTAPPPPPECVSDSDCSDNDPCTADQCAVDTCQHATITGCCTVNSDCDDSNPCTANACQGNVCSTAPISGCCGADDDCADNNPCTIDSCDKSSGVCSYEPVAGCCAVDTDCDDGKVCTADRCDTASNTCEQAPISGCCTMDSQCDDGTVCTADSCDVTSNSCITRSISGCCTEDSHCDDGNACSTDSCQQNICQTQPIGSCCSVDADCVDTNPCTSDTCDTSTGMCKNSAQQGCCSVDVDCDDDDECTLDSCDLASNSCTNETSAGCDRLVTTGATLRSHTALLEGGCSVGDQPKRPSLLLLLLLVAVIAAAPICRHRRSCSTARRKTGQTRLRSR